jgi:hypothetical protein
MPNQSSTQMATDNTPLPNNRSEITTLNEASEIMLPI